MTSTEEIQCESCGALVSVQKGEFTTRCLFCDAPSVISRGTGHRGSTPKFAFALGFSVEHEAASKAVAQWIGRKKMAPFGLQRATAERITGVYLPAHLYSATVESHYQASIGENYEKLTVKSGSNGGVSVGKREETEYRDLSGTRVAYVADVVVSASRNVTNEELAAIEPFDLGKLRRYSAVMVTGWKAEEPSRTPDESSRLARAEVEASIGAVLRNFMPGDEVRSLRQTTGFVEESLDEILVPVWVFAIRYHPQKPPLRILVNGQTGKVGGMVPVSWAKVALWIAVVAVFGLLLLAAPSVWSFVRSLL